MTCTESGIYACERNEVPKPVQWPRACVGYEINEVGTQNVSDAEPGLSAELERAVTDSFAAWDEVECSRMQLTDRGLTDLSAAEFNQQSDARNSNLVVWRDENWNSVASRQTFALTSVSYNPNTGEIADADIEINAQYYPISTTDPVEANHIDLRNTLVHEVGHFIGLDHTSVERATMFASADIGEVDKRTLHPDDVDAICHVYPADQTQMLGCDDPEPPDTPPGDNGNGCCATTQAPAPGTLNWLFLAAGFVALAGARRRRRQ
jgi:MYXO-CTERM domain-containing protein